MTCEVYVHTGQRVVWPVMQKQCRASETYYKAEFGKECRTLCLRFGREWWQGHPVSKVLEGNFVICNHKLVIFLTVISKINLSAVKQEHILCLFRQLVFY